MKKMLLLIAFLPVLSHAQIINTIAGNGTPGYSGDSIAATMAKLNGPNGVAVDGSGNIYICDFNNNRIRKINSSGIISTIAGTGTPGYSGDGGPATIALIKNPNCITIDASGNILFAEYTNHVIRKINTAGIISTIAGNGTSGFGGDGGLASAPTCQLSYPPFIYIDPSGDIIIADANNQRIRKINSAGIINTIAGTGVVGFSGDGGAALSAQLRDPFGLVMDAAGNLYIADQDNNRIRKVSLTGIITTIAGIGPSGSLGGYAGDGGPASSAQFNIPTTLVLDAAGNLDIADRSNNCVRQINASTGIISTIAGIGGGSVSYSGDGGPATAAHMSDSRFVNIDAAGNLYVSDFDNNRLRMIPSVCTNDITKQPVPDTVIAGTVATFSVTTTMSSPIFQWQQNAGAGFVNLANVLPYSGVTTNTLTIHNSDMFLNETNYRCYITNDPQIVGPHCTDTSESAILIIDDNTGINNLARELINIYPNPAHNVVTIQIPDNAAAYVQLINEVGQVLSEQMIVKNTLNLDLEKYPAGLYIAKINWDGNIVYKKITKR